MIQTLKNAWKIEDLRKKLLYTMMILFVVRLGSAIPVPFLDPTRLNEMVGASGNFFSYLDLLTEAGLGYGTVTLG